VIEGEKEGVRLGRGPDRRRQGGRAEEPAHLLEIEQAQLDGMGVVEVEERRQVLGCHGPYRASARRFHRRDSPLRDGEKEACTRFQVLASSSSIE
jgi:hypothetical protein